MVKIFIYIRSGYKTTQDDLTKQINKKQMQLNVVYIRISKTQFVNYNCFVLIYTTKEDRYETEGPICGL